MCFGNHIDRIEMGFLVTYVAHLLSCCLSMETLCFDISNEICSLQCWECTLQSLTMKKVWVLFTMVSFDMMLVI
jgi:hypothetical protein